MTRSATAFLVLAAVAALATAARAKDDSVLDSPKAFDSIPDKAERSAALFTEAAKVLTHPRCINCHPAGDQPLQARSDRAHEPPVRRGRGGLGAVGMRCRTCHSTSNFDPGRVPGAPLWRLAPSGMAWEGLTLTALCEQIKDPERNGRRTLDEVLEHMSEDALVGWGWSPGADREPAPGSQEEFGALIRAWIKTGAACP
jgi:hypothetical protein